MSGSGSSSSSGSEMVVAVVSQDPNTWVVLGRLIGITLAIVEAGKLLSSALVAHEVKRSTEFFQKCREEAYTRLDLETSPPVETCQQDQRPQTRQEQKPRQQQQQPPAKKKRQT